MKVLKSVFSQLHLYLLWALLSVILWGFVFGLLTDAGPEKKLLLCVDRPELPEQALEEELERDRPAGIRFVKTHAFSYYLFGGEELLNADLYIVGDDRASEFADSFCPLEKLALPAMERELWTRDGLAYGVKIYDAQSGEGAALQWIDYAAEGEEPRDYYLFFGVNSRHLEDGNAVWLAEKLLSLP